MRKLIFLTAPLLLLASCVEEPESRCRGGAVFDSYGQCVVPDDSDAGLDDSDADEEGDATNQQIDPDPDPDPDPVPDPDADPNIQGILNAMNAARSVDQDCGSRGARAAVPPVTGHPLLHEAAQRHADDMAENGFFSHTGSDGSSFGARIAESGYSGSPVAENIAGGGTDPANIIQRWLDSDGHCANLMTPSGNQIGVGFALGGNWGTLWVLKVGNGP